jgi:hypothetical protein
MKNLCALTVLVAFAASSSFAADNLVKEAIDGKVREGKGGTSNKNADKQMKEIDKAEKAESGAKASPTPKPEPKK